MMQRVFLIIEVSMRKILQTRCETRGGSGKHDEAGINQPNRPCCMLLTQSEMTGTIQNHSHLNVKICMCVNVCE